MYLEPKIALYFRGSQGIRCLWGKGRDIVATQWRPHGENMKYNGKEGVPMGDKGKKDKEKGKKQTTEKQKQESLLQNYSRSW
jgi:hypothetical protein